jgi:GTP cyclohydrolase II
VHCIAASPELSRAISGRHAPVLESRKLQILAETPLPTRYGVLRCLVFSLSDEPLCEHVAMLAGDVDRDDVLVFVHAECLTSEVFGSLRCDCRERLELALARIAAEGRGVLIYRRRALGLPDDEPPYDAAASMLKELGVASVRLLGGDAVQAEEFEALGIRVGGRVPLARLAQREHPATGEAKSLGA